MKAIRKGNDIKIMWSIFMRDGTNNIPYILQGKNLTLYVLSPNLSVTKITDFNIDGNVLIWTFKGKEQSKSGSYKLTLVENDGEDEMRTLDRCDAFRLVNCSCQEEGDDTSRINTSILELNSSFDVTENIDISTFVTTVPQTLTEEQQAQARENIGASVPDLSDYLKKKEAQETYHPKTTFKTINGESIEGKGNITIDISNSLPDYSALADGNYVLKGIKSGNTMTLYWSLDSGEDTPDIPVTPDEPDDSVMWNVIYRFINPDSAVIKPSYIEKVADGTKITLNISDAPNIQGYAIQTVFPPEEIIVNGDTVVDYVYTSTSAIPEEVYQVNFKYLSDKGDELHTEVSVPFVRGVEINMPQDIAEFIFDFEGYTLSSISPNEDFAVSGETEIVLTYEKS